MKRIIAFLLLLSSVGAVKVNETGNNESLKDILPAEARESDEMDPMDRDDVLFYSRLPPPPPPFAETRLGGIHGMRKEYLGRYVDAFLGIPYAQPPVGALRFKAPEPAYAWEVPINATAFGAACRQNLDEWPEHLTRGSHSCSEDCLYLNIWKPSEKVSKPRPVMVYIHGGDFLLGSSAWPEYDGGLISAFGDVVVASMNYRLGRLGFLDAKSQSAPGNQGLLDQNMALRWIHDNINAFGGDMDQVTLFGNDAGAASIGLHILSPLSAGLFRRAILQSGSAFWKLRQSRISTGLDYGEITSGRSMDDIYNIYGPTYDNDFLPLNPHMSASMGIFNDVDVLIGTNDNEGAWEYMRANRWQNFSSVENFKAIKLLKFIKGFFEEFRFKELIGSKATEGIYYYFASNLRGNDIQHNRQFVFDFIGDYVHTCPLTYFAEFLSDRNITVHYYRFSHSPPHQHPDSWPIWVGATHFDEVPFVFGAPLLHSHKFSTAERDLTASIMDTWTSFAKTGSPVTPNGQAWPRFTRKSPDYLRLSTQGFGRRDTPSKENCNFWRSFHNFDVWKHAKSMEK